MSFLLRSLLVALMIVAGSSILQALAVIIAVPPASSNIVLAPGRGSRECEFIKIELDSGNEADNILRDVNGDPLNGVFRVEMSVDDSTSQIIQSLRVSDKDSDKEVSVQEIDCINGVCNPSTIDDLKICFKRDNILGFFKDNKNIENIPPLILNFQLINVEATGDGDEVVVAEAFKQEFNVDIPNGKKERKIAQKGFIRRQTITIEANGDGVDAAGKQNNRITIPEGGEADVELTFVPEDEEEMFNTLCLNNEGENSFAGPNTNPNIFPTIKLEVNQQTFELRDVIFGSPNGSDNSSSSSSGNTDCDSGSSSSSDCDGKIRRIISFNRATIFNKAAADADGSETATVDIEDQVVDCTNPNEKIKLGMKIKGLNARKGFIPLKFNVLGDGNRLFASNVPLFIRVKAEKKAGGGGNNGDNNDNQNGNDNNNDDNQQETGKKLFDRDEIFNRIFTEQGVNDVASFSNQALIAFTCEGKNGTIPEIINASTKAVQDLFTESQFGILNPKAEAQKLRAKDRDSLGNACTQIIENFAIVSGCQRVRDEMRDRLANQQVPDDIIGIFDGRRFEIEREFGPIQTDVLVNGGRVFEGRSSNLRPQGFCGEGIVREVEKSL